MSPPCLEKSAHATREGIEYLLIGLQLSQTYGRQHADVLSDIPPSTVSELLALQDDLNKLLRRPKRISN
jgi:hypothetical protein